MFRNRSERSRSTLRNVSEACCNDSPANWMSCDIEESPEKSSWNASPLCPNFDRDSLDLKIEPRDENSKLDSTMITHDQTSEMQHHTISTDTAAKAVAVMVTKCSNSSYEHCRDSDQLGYCD